MFDKFFYIVTLLILILLKPEKFEDFSGFLIIIYSSVYLILIVFFLGNQRRYEKNWLRFDVLFLIGYTIVHLQIPFLASIGFEPSRPYFVWINKEVVNYSTWLSVLAINLWMLGYSFYNVKLKRISTSEIPIEQDFPKSFLTLDLVLLCAFLGFMFSAGSVVLKGVYNVNSWGASAVYFLMIFQILLYLRTVYFFNSISSRASIRQILKSFTSNKIFFIVYSSYFLVFFLTGSRGEILGLFLVTALCYSIYIKRISLKIIVLFIFIGSFVFTLMGLGRLQEAGGVDNRGILERGYESLITSESDGKGKFTEELATSVRIQYRAIDTVPYNYPYLYGTTYIASLFGVVPFASGLVVEAFDIPPQYLGSANFFTYVGQGVNPSYGEGSEILADLYINFGVYGVFIIMYFFGMFSGKCNLEMRKKRIVFVLLYAVLIVYALGINRGTIFYLYKDFFYILLFHYFFKKRNYERN